MSLSKAQREAAELAARGAFTAYGSVAVARHELTIPLWRPATVNELTKRGNHYAASGLKKRDRKIVTAYALKVGTPKATGKRRVSLIVARSGRMNICDEDAFDKSAWDALKHAGLLIDDKPAWCTRGAPPLQPKVQGDHYTTIILEDL